MTYTNFRDAIQEVRDNLANGHIVDAQQWQSIQIPDSVRFRESLNNYFTVDLANEVNDLEFWVDDIQPNIPWADTAYHERVGGIPWNPGTAWESWPYAKSAENFKQERFSHSYAERYWPRRAGFDITDQQWRDGETDNDGRLRGIRFDYGDLHHVVELMNKDPLTRQAYLPIWFPEDTGVAHGERVPCTLGYHFIHRDGKMDITYYIRSCDFVRHFRDDLYMTLRLLFWMIERVDFISIPGTFTFHCVSMHCFEHDKI